MTVIWGKESSKKGMFLHNKSLGYSYDEDVYPALATASPQSFASEKSTNNNKHKQTTR
jgi:hypothetical protein